MTPHALAGAGGGVVTVPLRLCGWGGWLNIFSPILAVSIMSTTTITVDVKAYSELNNP